MVGTFRHLPLLNNAPNVWAWCHGVPNETAAPHRMVPFWYLSLVIWREWTVSGEIADVTLRLHGPQPNPYFYAPRRPTELIGIAIAPELAQNALGISNDDCAGQIVEWQDDDFDNALLLASGGRQVDAIADAMARPILNMITDIPSGNVDLAVAMIRRTRGTASLRAVSDRIGLSERQFRTGFKKRVGLSAKAYSRIVRANAIISQADRTDTPDWADLSYQYGFFDQAHMINDLRNLTGQSPAILSIERKAE
ncbi:helix-turn-helix domain-containing protein [Erythrobacter sp. F6033]|uniref:helix-turn-helix domain-containing protein n=1 Tax=Erythrobacter sp. F6033 TaxID=2926401 RepID=UPI001FF56219|nr:helix-turn-helix domain-containing protein [Erythrobacter sp. F6033]MCK0127603.1 helix-turn-helix domain-containing protein [Erythrobacter sp. F6033]